MQTLPFSLTRDDCPLSHHLHCRELLNLQRDSDFPHFSEPDLDLPEDDEHDDCFRVPMNFDDDGDDEGLPGIPPPLYFASSPPSPLSVDLDDQERFPVLFRDLPEMGHHPSARRRSPADSSLLALNADAAFGVPPPPPPPPFIPAVLPPRSPPPVSIPRLRVDERASDADGDAEMATDEAHEPPLPEMPLRTVIVGDFPNCHAPPPPVGPQFDFLNSVVARRLQRRNDVLAYKTKQKAYCGEDHPFPSVSPEPLKTALQSLEWLGPRTSALGRNTNRKDNPVRFLMRPVIWNGYRRMVRVALFSRSGHGAYFVQLPRSDPRLELIDISVSVEEFFQMQKDASGREFLTPRAKKDRTRVGFKSGFTSYFGPLGRNSPNPFLSFHQIDQNRGAYRLRFKLNGADIRQTGRNKRLVYRMGLVWFRAGVPVFFDQIFFQMKKDSIPTERKQGVIRTPIFTWTSPRYDEGLGDLCDDSY